MTTPSGSRKDARRAWGLGCGSLLLALLALAALAWTGPRVLRSIAFLTLLLVAALGYYAVVLTAVAREAGLGRGVLPRLEMALRAWVARFARDPEGLWIAWAEQVSDTQVGLECLERAGPLGPRGAFELGLAYLEGPAKDRAIPWFRRAAEQGHAGAMVHLAESLRWALAGVRDFQEAELWEQRARAAGPAGRRPHSVLRGGAGSAERALGKAEDLLDLLWARPWMPWLALGAFVLLLPAIGLYLAAFTLLVAPLLWLPKRFINGPEARMGGTLKRLIACAEAGEAPAALALARFYLEGGQGLPKDPLSARLWFRRAAEAGEPEAMAALGGMLASGHGGPPDPVQARGWFEAAEKAGHPGASDWLRDHPLPRA